MIPRLITHAVSNAAANPSQPHMAINIQATFTPNMVIAALV